MADLEICRARMTVVYVRSCVGRLRWSPSLRYCVRGTTSTKTSGMRVLEEWYAVAVMRRSAIIVGQEPRKISAACSLFLADQLLAAISGRSVTEVL